MIPLVSIIIPVYNAEMYVSRCIESVLNQSYANIELILVNDGSTDTSNEICQEYEMRDDRVFLLAQRNGGVAKARNTGIDIMSGEYVTFVDSDDYLHPDAIRILISAAESHSADICMGGFQEIRNTVVDGFETSQLVTDTVSVMQAWRGLFGSEHLKYGTVWGSVYKSKLFDTIRFPNNQIFEDTYIIQDLYGLSHVIATVNLDVYYYAVRDSSISHTWTAETTIDSLLATAKRYAYFYEKDIQELIMQAANLHLDHAILCYESAEHWLLKETILGLYNVIWDSYRTVLPRDHMLKYAVFAKSPALYYACRKTKCLMAAMKRVLAKRAE